MEKNTIRILYLDDEVENLVAFKAAFRKVYEVHIASSPQEALELLIKNDIHIFMIDQRMPEVNGIDLLQLINEDFPQLIKILVTGYVDLGDSLEDAIGGADVYRYINKPWTENEIQVSVADAYKAYCFKKEKNNELKALKTDLATGLKGPIANIEGLLALAEIEIKDEYALRDYFEYMNKSLDTIKNRLNSILQPRMVEEKEEV